MTERRVLPADVYDALELSALAFGGIGGGAWYEIDNDGKRPLCATGHRWFLQGDVHDCREIAWAFDQANIHSGTNDPAVRAINKRSGKEPCDRVPFEKWCKALNVVRGT